MASKTAGLETREEKKPLPKLNTKQKMMMLAGSASPTFFNGHTRPMLYKLSRDEKGKEDPELVHDIVIDMAHRQGTAAILIEPLFIPPRNLKVRIYKDDVLPFGTAAGMDKNCDALEAFGRFFGYQKPGTIVVPERRGNDRVRMATLEDEWDLLNSQGFPSKGMVYSQVNLGNYRAAGGEAKIYANVCGLPGEGPNGLQTAFDDMRILITNLGKHVNGFEWNPYSPNTELLKLLRTPEVFRETAKLMREYAGDKLLVVKLGPYEENETNLTMKLLESFILGGGNGATTTNTKPILKRDLPESIRDTWGYSVAGRSGDFLREYRLRSVTDIRERFPDAIIMATGGIYTPEDAYDTFKAGANTIEGYTPYTYFGPGLARILMRGVAKQLKAEGYESLWELQGEVKYNILHGTCFFKG